MKWAISIGAVALAVLGHGYAQAQELGGEEDDGAATKLGRLVVTAPLRRESTLARSTSSVTVISRQQIDQSAAADLPSLLKSYPGVSVTSNGGIGAVSGVSIRGTAANQTLVLINGVRAGTATLGTVRLSSIPLDSIERIEIAKGTHSAQYGADAIGGVINIITRQGGPCDDGRDACGSVTAGVTHPWGGFLSGEVHGQSGNGVNYAFGSQLLGTEGYDFTTSPYDLDDDGFLQGSAIFSLSKDFDWGRLYADGALARGRNQYDSAYAYDGSIYYPADEANSTTFAGKIGTRVDHSDSWFSTIELSTATDNESNFRGNEDGDDFDTFRYGIFASTEKTIDTGNAEHTLTGGVEAYRESVGGSSIYDAGYDKTQRDLEAIFGQYSLQYEALTIDSGIRYDHDEQFGGAATYNVGASYLLSDGLSIHASYATGFRAPTFNDLYYPGAGNPDLEPEESRSYEIGMRWQPTDDTSLDLALYQTMVRNQIIWVPDNPRDPYSLYFPQNVARVKITGFEATLAHRFNAQWSGKISADIRQPLDESAGLHGKYITNADRFKATAEVTYKPIDALDLTARVHYGAARYVYAPVYASGIVLTTKLPDYVTADFVANYAFDAQSQLRLSVENIFDEQYQTVSGYRAPGRAFDISLTRAF